MMADQPIGELNSVLGTRAMCTTLGPPGPRTTGATARAHRLLGRAERAVYDSWSVVARQGRPALTQLGSPLATLGASANLSATALALDSTPQPGPRLTADLLAQIVSPSSEAVRPGAGSGSPMHRAKPMAVALPKRRLRKTSARNAATRATSITTVARRTAFPLLSPGSPRQPVTAWNVQSRSSRAATGDSAATRDARCPLSTERRARGAWFSLRNATPHCARCPPVSTGRNITVTSSLELVKRHYLNAAAANFDAKDELFSTSYSVLT
jgi:hypothetical protein